MDCIVPVEEVPQVPAGRLHTSYLPSFPLPGGLANVSRHWMLPSPRNELGLKCRRRTELLSIPLDSLHLVVFSATSLAQFSLASDLPAATSLRSTGYAFILVDTTLVHILVNQPTLVESIPAAVSQVKSTL
ncbi:hypothetical protein TWF225_009260 [Orbilia oligospora]|uniref:Uncharacterized protein n=1 Tax=Orbilia oligospora TaxID=2813651 RepID=A0A7C8U2J2_ORBOL|nr:hypothetical protein TWF751_010087 [Orbilia oligospora]KAF3193710.1 hypothetical protein TWF225_009260 [Orbilia oligospora]KAF3269895.1 hypothetical protein TWF217_008244 [Orbilia oligospora]KAF3270353.1 hypothetical protein TWF128_004135 [Orbilia oligospora]KAF3276193.1 hypothetical protein TWF132_002288 [Orbilia oligospora]